MFFCPLLFADLRPSVASDKETSAETFSALARRTKDGDADAFRVLFDALYDGLLRYMGRFKLPAEEADDVIQQAFVYVWMHREQIDPSKSIRAYLYRAVHTRALNALRDRAKHTPLDAISANEEAEPAGLDAAETGELRALLDQAIDSLPDRQRAVFMLCYVEGMRYQEAAETLEISTKTVENHMSRALKTLRELLHQAHNEYSTDSSGGE